MVRWLDGLIVGGEKEGDQTYAHARQTSVSSTGRYIRSTWFLLMLALTRLRARRARERSEFTFMFVLVFVFVFEFVVEFVVKFVFAFGIAPVVAIIVVIDFRVPVPVGDGGS